MTWQSFLNLQFHFHNLSYMYINNLTGIILLKTWIHLIWRRWYKCTGVDKLENITNHNSRFAKHLSDTKEWFRLRRRELVWEQASCHKQSGKDYERNFKSLMAVSNLHKLEYVTVICKWPYLVIPMSIVLCHTTKDRHRCTWWNAQTLFLKLKAWVLESHLHTLWTLKVSHIRTFLSTRGEQMSMFNLRYVQ